MKIHLSERLAWIHSRLLSSEPVWDICCDHGILGLAALQSGHPEVIFVDQVVPILENLRQKLKDSPQILPEQSDQRHRVLCLDAQNLSEKLYGTVVVAGVGGFKIADFISAWSDRQIISAKRFILSPHKDLIKVKNEMNLLEDYNLTEEVRLESRTAHWNILVYDRIEVQSK